MNRVLEFEDLDTAGAAIKQFIKEGDLLLLKASRATRLERISDLLRSGEARRLSQIAGQYRDVYRDPARLVRKDREQAIHGPIDLLKSILAEGSVIPDVARISWNVFVTLFVGGLLGGLLMGIYWTLTSTLFNMHCGDAFGALGIKNFKHC